MPQAIDAAKRKQAHALYLAGVKTPIIAERVGVKIKSVQSWITRGGWKASLEEAGRVLKENHQQGVAVVATQQVSRVTEKAIRARETAAELLQKLLDKLNSEPIEDVAKLLNSPAGEGLASALKRLTDVGNVVHGWSESPQENSLIIPFLLDDPPAEPETPAIPVETVMCVDSRP